MVFATKSLLVILLCRCSIFYLLDLKIYNEGSLAFSASQIEVVSPASFIDKKSEIKSELEKIRDKNNYY